MSDHYVCKGCDEPYDKCDCNGSAKPLGAKRDATTFDPSPGAVNEAREARRYYCVIEQEIAEYDIDQTLFLWHDPNGWSAGPYVSRSITVTNPYTGITHTGWVHEPHVYLLKNDYGRGRYIRVHSHTGARWAEAVIKALGLEGYVHSIEHKCDRYVDDQPAKNWKRSKIELDPNDPWGRGNK